MNQPMRYRPRAFSSPDSPPAASVRVSISADGHRMKAKEIQKAPYELNAVAPNVLPAANLADQDLALTQRAHSHMPASSCARPP